MKERWDKYLLLSGLIIILSGCSYRPTDRGQQYQDGHIDQKIRGINQINIKGAPVNSRNYLNQLLHIKRAAPSLFKRHKMTYQAIEEWLSAGADTTQLNQYNLTGHQMKGVDNYGNVHFTGYYTPVLQARHTKQSEFRHPLYRMPIEIKQPLPSRASIYSGALNERYIIAYTNSLIDNFIMEVQGSGYIDYGNGQPLVLFEYGGQNSYAYRSIGKILIERGAIARKDMSLQMIQKWAATHSIEELRALLEQNPSFVFFHPTPFSSVKGASSVPLISKASVAADSRLIPPGTTLLTEVPLLNKEGRFTGKYEIQLTIALDVGGSIKGQHIDLYRGVGSDAGKSAGYYNHYGRAWVLRSTSRIEAT